MQNTMSFEHRVNGVLFSKPEFSGFSGYLNLCIKVSFSENSRSDAHWYWNRCDSVWVWSLLDEMGDKVYREVSGKLQDPSNWPAEKEGRERLLADLLYRLFNADIERRGLKPHAFTAVVEITEMREDPAARAKHDKLERDTYKELGLVALGIVAIISVVTAAMWPAITSAFDDDYECTAGRGSQKEYAEFVDCLDRDVRWADR